MSDIPTEVHLYWATYEGGLGGHFTLQSSDCLSKVKNYHWLGSAPVNFGDVIFDEKELTLKSLNRELGEARGKVNFIMDRIQNLLALGHDDPQLKTSCFTGSKFDDDIPV